jgi:shikimate kinase
MGSGKTYQGRRLSERFNLPFFDLDDEIEKSENKTINEIFSLSGEEYFRSIEKELLHTISSAYPGFIMSCGGGAPCYFDNMDFMNRSGTTVWLKTSEATLFNRLLHEKESRPLLRGLTEEALRSFIAERLSTRKKYYEQAAYSIEEGDAGFDQLIEKILHA